MGCLAAEAVCDSERHLSNAAVSRGAGKKGEIRKAVVHVWLSGTLSSLPNVFPSFLIVSVLLDSGFSPGLAARSYYIMDINAFVS